MRKAPCADLAELRSAFVDSSISAAGREKLLAHLAGCPPCRREIEDLRLIRELLNRSSATPVPPPARSASPIGRHRRRRGPPPTLDATFSPGTLTGDLEPAQPPPRAASPGHGHHVLRGRGAGRGGPDRLRGGSGQRPGGGRRPHRRCAGRIHLDAGTLPAGWRRFGCRDARRRGRSVVRRGAGRSWPDGRRRVRCSATARPDRRCSGRQPPSAR